MKKLNETQTVQIIGGSPESYAYWSTEVVPGGSLNSYCSIIYNYQYQPYGSYQWSMFPIYQQGGYLDGCPTDDY